MKRNSFSMILLSAFPVLMAGGLVGTLGLISGCSITPEQAVAIADQAGMYSAVGWIALDNPDTQAVAVVKTVMVTAETHIAEVKAGKTYTEVVYPELAKVIDKDVPSQYKPIAKAGVLSLLGGLDLLFAIHPEWKTNETLALNIATAYAKGAERGLGLSPDSPIMKQARKTAMLRTANKLN